MIKPEKTLVQNLITNFEVEIRTYDPRLFHYLQSIVNGESICEYCDGAGGIHITSAFEGEDFSEACQYCGGNGKFSQELYQEMFEEIFNNMLLENSQMLIHINGGDSHVQSKAKES
jgi:excinuclease UvrABC ATPase subunit